MFEDGRVGGEVIKEILGCGGEVIEETLGHSAVSPGLGKLFYSLDGVSDVRLEEGLDVVVASSVEGNIKSRLQRWCTVSTTQER